MAWTAYKVVLRLRSPMHIGKGKVGNLQRTRPYVAGRSLWGALTAHLTREEDGDGRPDPEEYPKMGQLVHTELAFTYLFPTTDPLGCEPLFPHLDARGNWGYGQDGGGAPSLDASTFRYRFLSTYASTALDYTAYSAEEASLHEVECLTPYTRDGIPVFLTGYLFQRGSSALDWQRALRRLQIGGERGYGWGQVEVKALTETRERDMPLFGTDHVARLDVSPNHVILELANDQPVLAHVLAADFEKGDDGKHEAVPGDLVEGSVEPLVGRETKPDTKFGVHLSNARICYVPGSRVAKNTKVQIGPFGVWERCPEPRPEPVEGPAEGGAP